MFFADARESPPPVDDEKNAPLPDALSGASDGSSPTVGARFDELTGPKLLKSESATVIVATADLRESLVADGSTLREDAERACTAFLRSTLAPTLLRMSLADPVKAFAAANDPEFARAVVEPLKQRREISELSEACASKSIGPTASRSVVVFSLLAVARVNRRAAAILLSRLSERVYTNRRDRDDFEAEALKTRQERERERKRTEAEGMTDEQREARRELRKIGIETGADASWNRPTATTNDENEGDASGPGKTDRGPVEMIDADFGA